VKLKREFNEKLPLIENFELKLNELSEAVKFLTKLNLEKLKNNKEKSKVVPFKPEDLDKIKEHLNVSSTGT
jgi:DNA-binding Xre family transcriptional regulator